ncbi:MAG: tRNA threonylcarbamoyladenosine dehydratase [Rhizobacter sp.]
MTPDLERRFGGLRRLYGDAQYERLRKLRIAVVGLGGVGSWAVEALARCGVASLTLIDLDHVAESNINRQVQALGATIGQSKVQALANRIADIHPGCAVHGVEEFVDENNWPQLLPETVDVVIDACDQVTAKWAMARWAMLLSRAVSFEKTTGRSEISPTPSGGLTRCDGSGSALVMVGAAGGKHLAHQVQVADLSEVTHDRLLASLRQRLRRSSRDDVASSVNATKKQTPLGLRCVFSKEAVNLPSTNCELPGSSDGSLNCHGYGSSVMVTATFGMVAAQEALRLGLQDQ